MKLGIVVCSAFWTAVAVAGFWGWFGFCTLCAVAVWLIERKGGVK